ncbi:MAG: cadherin-like domain-containing protein, partial [Phycisphaerales bacterium]|nr:cadherin-like domain-containing protein [Phycisphaerales bacterium]
ADQVQALNVANVSIGYLTPDQREMLTPDQVDDLGYTQFRYLPVDQVEHLTPDQIATIPNSSWFATMSADARAELDADQVQGLNVAKVSIGYLTPDQREALTVDQVQSLGYSDFRYLPTDRIHDLTPDQISSIPNTSWFNQFNADQRDALTHEQIRAINGNIVGVTFTGDDGENVITGNGGINNIIGGGGDDSLAGGDGRDVLAAGAGNDTLDGGAGDDWLIAGGGNDVMAGGSGDDRFSFENPQNGDVYEVSGDEGRDWIDLSQFDSSQATISNGVITIDLGDGDHFTINHTGIEAARFSDGLYGAGLYNTPPVAVDTGATLDEDGVVNLTPIGLDPDAGDAIESFRIDSLPENGVLTLNGEPLEAGAEVTAQQITDGSLKFEPNENWNGDTSFTYSASDGEDWSDNTATFTIHVDAVNDAPTGIVGGVSVPEDGETMISLAGADVDGAVQTFRIDSLPDGGTLTLNGQKLNIGDEISVEQLGDGGFKFAADPNWNGTTGFKFSAFDGEAWSSDPSEFEIRVLPANDAPEAIGGDITIGDTREGVINLDAFDIDDGDTIESFRIDTLPAGGTLMLNGEAVTPGQEIAASDITEGSLTFVAGDGVSGDTDLLFSAYDGSAWSEPGVFTLHVAPEAASSTPDFTFDAPSETPLTLEPDLELGDNPTIIWRQMDGPSVELSDPHSAAPTIDAPKVGEPTVLRFQVDVTEGGITTTRTIDVVVSPTVDDTVADHVPPPAETPNVTPTIADTDAIAPPSDIQPDVAVNPADIGPQAGPTTPTIDAPETPIASEPQATTPRDSEPADNSAIAQTDTASDAETSDTASKSDGDEWRDVTGLEVLDATTDHGAVIEPDAAASHSGTVDESRFEAIDQVMVDNISYTTEPGEVRLDPTYNVDEQIYFPTYSEEALQAGFDEVGTIRAVADPLTGEFVSQTDEAPPSTAHNEAHSDEANAATAEIAPENAAATVFGQSATGDGFLMKLWGLIRGFGGPRDIEERDKAGK